MKLETKRLILRKPKKSDWKDIVEGVGEKDVSKTTVNIPFPYGKKEALFWLDKVIKEWKKKEKESYSFLIELKSEKKIIGNIEINEVNKFHRIGNTSSWINKKYWKKGYIAEAKIAVNDFAFNKLKLRRLKSIVFVGNKASNATQKKMGYKLEGMMRKAVKSRATRKIHDEYIYGLLKEDWKKVRSKLIKEMKKLK